jgi:signal transduction histidine kinase
MDGLELVRRIRAAGANTSYVYVVLASGLGEEEHARDGMLAGADDYLAKPLRRGQLELKLISAHRVTTLHRHLERLNDDLRRTTIRDAETNRRLSNANQLQADMIAMLSHEARQPLTAVIGFTEATIDGWETTLDEIKREHLIKAAGAARRLDQLIDDVLTMANLESGAIRCRPTSLVVAETIREIIRVAVGPTPVDLIGDQSGRALVDPWQLRQIMTNLIVNATKYGLPPIRVSIEPVGSSLEIHVTDSGEGVPADFVPRLFDRFSRAESGIATRKQGSGFGLYIVRRLLEANDGQIAYRPGVDTGARFTVTLPRAGPSAQCE